MIKPSIDFPSAKNLNQYSLVIAIAKRARQIVDEAEEKNEIIVEKSVDLAVQDYIDHKFIIVNPCDQKKQRKKFLDLP